MTEPETSRPTDAPTQPASTPAVDAAIHAPALHPLVARLRAGDQRAVAEVYDQFAPRLLAFTTGVIGNRHRAEDVVQDCFVALVRNLASLTAETEPELHAWLLRTARNRCIDLARSARSRRERSTASLPETGVHADEPTAIDPDLVGAIQRLPERQRTAIVLRRVLDLDGEQAGEVMGIDREAVYALSARAERKLRKWLTTNSPDPPPEPTPRTRHRDTRHPKEGGSA